MPPKHSAHRGGVTKQPFSVPPTAPPLRTVRQIRAGRSPQRDVPVCLLTPPPQPPTGRSSAPTQRRPHGGGGGDTPAPLTQHPEGSPQPPLVPIPPLTPPTRRTHTAISISTQFFFYIRSGGGHSRTSAAVAQLLKTRRALGGGEGGLTAQESPGGGGRGPSGLSVGQLVGDEFVVGAAGRAALRLPFVQPEPNDAAVVLFT